MITFILTLYIVGSPPVFIYEFDNNVDCAFNAHKGNIKLNQEGVRNMRFECNKYER